MVCRAPLGGVRVDVPQAKRLREILEGKVGPHSDRDLEGKVTKNGGVHGERGRTRANRVRVWALLCMSLPISCPIIMKSTELQPTPLLSLCHPSPLWKMHIAYILRARNLDSSCLDGGGVVEGRSTLSGVLPYRHVLFFCLCSSRLCCFVLAGRKGYPKHYLLPPIAWTHITH